MKTRYIGATLALTLASSTVLANPVTISGGSKDGAYDRWAHNLSNMLSGFGYSSLVARSKGSGENIDRVMSGEAALGFAQGDALMSKGARVEILGELGKECAFLVGATKGRVTDEDHLQNEQDPVLKIGVGKRGTGSQITWSYMVQLEPDYARSAAQYRGGARAQAAVTSGQLDAALFVTAPERLDHKLIVAVNNDKQLQFLDVDDKDLNDELPTGQPVYTFEDVDTKSGWGGGIKTICTPVLVIADPNADEDFLDDVATLLLTNKSAVLQ